MKNRYRRYGAPVALAPVVLLAAACSSSGSSGASTGGGGSTSGGSKAPYNIGLMFLNGLPLGMIWGLIFGFLEGRRTTEFLGSILCASFIVSSGVVKAVGAWLLVWWSTSTLAVFQYMGTYQSISVLGGPSSVANATCGPRLATGSNLSSESVAVTPMTCASAAGKSGGEFGPEFPTAAIMTMPRA